MIHLHRACPGRTAVRFPGNSSHVLCGAGGSWGLYFSKALFEGLIFEGAYNRRGLSTEGNLRFKIYWASLIVGSKFTVFALFSFVFEGNSPRTSFPGGLYYFGEAI